MTRKQLDKPTQEFWAKAREFIEWCTPEELRILRSMASTEMEKRLKGWDEKLAVKESEAKAKKVKAIRRNLDRASK
jgi:hypothetical protein